MAGSKYVDILNDGLLIQLSIKVPKHVTPSNLSYYLGFNAEEGDHAQILGLVQLDPKSAYESLVHKFVNRHGTDGKSALKLRLIFLKNDMVAGALIIEKELDKYGITYPSRADTVIGEPLDLPSTSNVKPELEKTGIVIPSRANTLTGQDVNPPSPPHDKPGSGTPVLPTSSGLQPQPRAPPVAPHQQQPYFGSGWIFAVVFAMIAVIIYFVKS